VLEVLLEVSKKDDPESLTFVVKVRLLENCIRRIDTSMNVQMN